MRKAPLYSRSPRRPAPGGPHTADIQAAVARPSEAGRSGATAASGYRADPRLAAAAAPAAPASVIPDEESGRPGRLRARLARHPASLAALGGTLLAALAMSLVLAGRPAMRVITQDDIDHAVRTSLEKDPLPSAAARAAAAIAPAVVRVVGSTDEHDDGDENAERKAMERALGTGVVIIDNGTILTNLHVVAGSRKVKVRFWNGLESDTQLVGTQPENDLAVLRALELPDDLEAATMRSTADLAPGDQVVAVGFPFGLGPSVSAGVVSGLRREFRSPDGQSHLTNLIQFDAAANPGNSGGPLVTMDGHLVGIVTAILNPNEQRTFIGIGFAVPIENAATAAGMPPF